MWRDSTLAERIGLHREQTRCGEPEAPETSGLPGYLGREPVAWAAVEPRVAYPKLRATAVPWRDRDEDKADEGVWAVTCMVVRKRFRGRGLAYPLARATIEYARERGARAALPDARRVRMSRFHREPAPL